MATSTKRQQAPSTARKSKADLAYEAIREQIIDGVSQPGTRLVLDRLARELDMSTLPVREAIRRLEAEGYVEFRRNIGATVSSLDVDGFVEALETFAVLESAATAQAAPCLTATDVEKADRSTRPWARHSLNSTASHTRRSTTSSTPCSSPAARISHLVRMLAGERARLQRVRLATLAVGAGGRREVDEHATLLEFIATGAPESDIEDLCRAHIAAVTDAFTS